MTESPLPVILSLLNFHQIVAIYRQYTQGEGESQEERMKDEG